MTVKPHAKRSHFKTDMKDDATVTPTMIRHLGMEKVSVH